MEHREIRDAPLLRFLLSSGCWTVHDHALFLTFVDHVCYVGLWAVAGITQRVEVSIFFRVQQMREIGVSNRLATLDNVGTRIELDG